MSVWRLSWRISQHEPWLAWVSTLLWTAFFTFPVVIGLVVGEAFAALDGGDIGRVQLVAVVLLVAEATRMVLLHLAATRFTRVWISWQSSLRANLLADQLADRVDELGRPVESPSGALSHFRDDAEDVARFIDGWIDVLGGVVFTVAAAVVLAMIDPVATAVLAVPMILVTVVTAYFGDVVGEARRSDREATARVTGALGEVVGAALTIKVNGASQPVLDHVATTMENRRHTAVRDRTIEAALRALGSSMTDVGLGLVLLVAAVRLRSGAFDVGDLVIFATYLTWIGFLPRMIGATITRRRQAMVAFDRMRRLVADDDAERTTTQRGLELHGSQPLRPGRVVPERETLERLDVDGLTVRLEGSTVVDAASCTIPAGSLTVVAGAVGAGKTSFLRGVLGLTWPDDTDGTVSWNGRPLDDRAAFLVPPNAAFLPQVPQLLSETLAENVLLGLAADDELLAALDLAQVELEVDAMRDGVDTRIGPRGVRLSGGQRQRVAAARAFVQRPELVVLDDLSSAVDVATELALWEAMARAGMTVLAVANRPVAIARADQVLVMEGGRLRVERAG
ncbi:MAG: ABC transporter ATP-binding protein [Actinomycetota bacterium]